MRIFAAFLCLMMATCPVLAQDKSRDKKAPSPPKMTEEQKLQALKTSCNKEADELKLQSNARKSFLAGCLNEPPPPASAAKADAKADAKGDAKARKP